jgi:hypothetical protein
MDYNKIYNNLIASRQLLNRQKFSGEYFESHHIIPVSLGGSSRKANLVLLTAKEHFIAHLLLYKMHTGRDKAKMANALFKMCSNNPNQQRDFISRYYEFSKNVMNKLRKGENTSFFGKKHSTETIEKMRKSRLGDKNPAFGKIPWNKGLTKCTADGMKQISDAAIERYSNPNNRIGKPHTTETKDKISKLHRGIPKSNEHKQKLSIANKGKSVSESTKRKLSEKFKGTKMPTGICNHCNKEMSVGTLHRWHNDNCRFKQSQ